MLKINPAIALHFGCFLIQKSQRIKPRTTNTIPPKSSGTKKLIIERTREAVPSQLDCCSTMIVVVDEEGVSDIERMGKE